MAVSPNRIKSIDYNGSKLEVLEIGELPEYDKQDYDLSDPKDKEKFLKDIEKMVRGSFEYRQLIKYMREFMDMNKCSFYENVNNIDTASIKIHIHHSPLTLYEIVQIVLNKRIFYNELINIEDVSAEVTYLHYCFLVGLIPLCETVHELVHNEYLFVPNDKVLGYYNEFLDLYKPWIPDTTADKMKRLEEYTQTYNEEENINPLRRSLIYLDFSGSYKLPKLEDVAKKMEQRMEVMRQTNFQGPKMLISIDDPQKFRTL